MRNRFFTNRRPAPPAPQQQDACRAGPPLCNSDGPGGHQAQEEIEKKRHRPPRIATHVMSCLRTVSACTCINSPLSDYGDSPLTDYRHSPQTAYNPLPTDASPTSSSLPLITANDASVEVSLPEQSPGVRASWSPNAYDLSEVVLVVERADVATLSRTKSPARTISPAHASFSNAGVSVACQSRDPSALALLPEESHLKVAISTTRPSLSAASVSTITEESGGTTTADADAASRIVGGTKMTASQLMLRARRRQSCQRRLDSLRGLVADLDLSNPWEKSHTAADEPESEQEVLNDASEDSGAVGMYPQPVNFAAQPETRPATDITSARQSSGTEDHRDRIDALYGPDEYKRQEVIWEMEGTERAFLRSIEVILRLFSSPLKTPMGTWIQGIPANFGRALDELERIFIIHRDLCEMLGRLRYRTSYVDPVDFVSLFDRWGRQLEVYEWYLVHFDTVVADIDRANRDIDSFLGEFIRMQSKKPEMGAMSLSSMLLKPVQRLMKYPLFLQRLIDVTPAPHRAHTPSLITLQCLQSTILRLQDMKAEHDDLKELEEIEPLLDGLPEGFCLAVPKRKLLGCAMATRVPSSVLSAGGASVSRASSNASSYYSAMTSARASNGPPDAIATLMQTTTRVSTFSQFSMASSAGLSRAGSMNGQQYDLSCPAMTRSPSDASSLRSLGSRSIGESRSALRKAKGPSVMLMIFNDLMITAVLNKTGAFGKGRKERRWTVLPSSEGGLGRILNHQDWSGWQGHSSLFTITVFPQYPVAGEEIAPLTRCFSLPASGRSPQITARCPQLADMPRLSAALLQAAPAVITSSLVEKDQSLAGLGLHLSL